MVKPRYSLIVDNSTPTDSKGSTVQLNFNPPIDLDLDRRYALTVAEVDVTYIQPNMINGTVGFSYVYTTPLATQGYVMRCMYDATQTTPTLRMNASGTTVDKWLSFYNTTTNLYADAIIPLTDTAGKTVVNNASQIPSQGSLMTVAQSMPTGLYDLDDLQQELINILERDPAYVSANSSTSSSSGVPPFRLIGCASTEQVQIIIYDPNLFIELPVAGQYAKNNVMYWLGFEPIVYQNESATPNLFTSTMAGAPLHNYLTVWTSSTFTYNSSGVKVYPSTVPKLGGTYNIPVYSQTSARLNTLTAYYLNTDIASGSFLNGQAKNVISTITPVDAQVGAIYSYRPIIPMQIPIRKYFIDQATFWMTDQNGNLADFSNNGQNDSPESWGFRAYIEELD